MISGLEIAILLIFAWIIIVIYLGPRISKTKHFSLFGPAIMIKITKNRGIIERFTKKFPGKSFGRISVIIVFASAILAVIILVYGAVLSFAIKPSHAAGLSLLLAIPGVNPVIPIGFGTVTLILAVVIHEFFHGVVAKKQGIKLSSVGVLWFVVPVGAFVEPDEQEITKSDPVVRRRIVAAGPGINIVLAVICFLLVALLVVPAASPTHDGLYVEATVSGSQVSHVISNGDEVVSLGNYTGNVIQNLSTISDLTPGQYYHASVYYGGSMHSVKVMAGLTIYSTISGLPAANISIPVGSVLVKSNNLTIYNATVLTDQLNKLPPGSKDYLEMMVPTSGSMVEKNFTLITTSEYYYYAKYDPSQNSNAYKNYSFIGITSVYSGFGGYTLTYMQSMLSGRQVFASPWSGMLQYIALPFLYLSPIPSSLASMYSTPFSPLLFWGIFDMLYWLFWWNFLLAIMNALPVVAFDGGQFFRDSMLIVGKHKSFSWLSKENNVRYVMIASSFFVLLLFAIEIYFLVV